MITEFQMKSGVLKKGQIDTNYYIKALVLLVKIVLSGKFPLLISLGYV